jgi:hypothetical protein
MSIECMTGADYCERSCVSCKPDVPRDKGQSCQELKKPADASFRRVGIAWGTPSRVAAKHPPGAPALFKRLRLFRRHPTHVFGALSRANACVLASSESPCSPSLLRARDMSAR